MDLTYPRITNGYLAGTKSGKGERRYSHARPYVADLRSRGHVGRGENVDIVCTRVLPVGIWVLRGASPTRLGRMIQDQAIANSLPGS